MRPETLGEAFAAGLTDPAAAVPQGVVDPEGKPAPKRYSVYRNNVTVSLVENLKAAYPAVMALMGEGPFCQIALEFVRAHPPTSPVMLHYGAGFAEHLEGREALAALPFISDVARLERAWLDSYHAADAVPLDPASLANLSAEQFAAIRFQIHPAARLVPSRFPVVDLFEAGRSGVGQGIDPNLCQWALVTRPDVSVQLLAVSEASAPFVEALMRGETLTKAAEAAAHHPGFDLQRVMQRLLPAGLFTAFELDA